jgi:hypothetical protein
LRWQQNSALSANFGTIFVKQCRLYSRYFSLVYLKPPRQLYTVLCCLVYSWLHGVTYQTVLGDLPLHYSSLLQVVLPQQNGCVVSFLFKATCRLLLLVCCMLCFSETPWLLLSYNPKLRTFDSDYPRTSNTGCSLFEECHLLGCNV